MAAVRAEILETRPLSQLKIVDSAPLIDPDPEETKAYKDLVEASLVFKYRRGVHLFNAREELLKNGGLSSQTKHSLEKLEVNLTYVNDPSTFIQEAQEAANSLIE